uniref:P-type domain-containing protein n=1 Tax=Chromera velia CCMP2878 TaxID=1169474 RepID=A0A0G4HX48_9ALVE|eukprot:Cvel_9189.t1-p1 / transcript=Cvel_9189.t1 / gene=Cvel_9189 / organism=Chromera_velia_CCMP2878 / gene_product=hypothetical protein / transcript_product=hypothetical protein / location=Cvel_scaffold523:77614-79912(-) / protein_length=621 / sequence_SO=supercontig / SO=protein_coding / is_pseudo=false
MLLRIAVSSAVLPLVCGGANVLTTQSGPLRLLSDLLEPLRTGRRTVSTRRLQDAEAETPEICAYSDADCSSAISCTKSGDCWQPESFSVSFKYEVTDQNNGTLVSVFEGAKCEGEPLDSVVIPASASECKEFDTPLALEDGTFLEGDGKSDGFILLKGVAPAPQEEEEEAPLEEEEAPAEGEPVAEGEEAVPEGEAEEEPVEEEGTSDDFWDPETIQFNQLVGGGDGSRLLMDLFEPLRTGHKTFSPLSAPLRRSLRGRRLQPELAEICAYSDADCSSEISCTESGACWQPENFTVSLKYEVTDEKDGTRVTLFSRPGCKGELRSIVIPASTDECKSFDTPMVLDDGTFQDSDGKSDGFILIKLGQREVPVEEEEEVIEAFPPEEQQEPEEEEEEQTPEDEIVLDDLFLFDEEPATSTPAPAEEKEEPATTTAAPAEEESEEAATTPAPAEEEPATTPPPLEPATTEAAPAPEPLDEGVSVTDSVTAEDGTETITTETTFADGRMIVRVEVKKPDGTSSTHIEHRSTSPENAQRVPRDYVPPSTTPAPAAETEEEEGQQSSSDLTEEEDLLLTLPLAEEEEVVELPEASQVEVVEPEEVAPVVEEGEGGDLWDLDSIQFNE